MTVIERTFGAYTVRYPSLQGSGIRSKRASSIASRRPSRRTVRTYGASTCGSVSMTAR